MHATNEESRHRNERRSTRARSRNSEDRHLFICFVNCQIRSGVENKDEILSFAQLEARQQLLPEEAEQCVSGVEPHNTAPVAAEENCAVPSSGAEIVTTEQTIATIPVRSGINQTPTVKLGANNNNNNNNNSAEELVELFSGGVASAGKVCVKVAAESEPASNRILRELNVNNSSSTKPGSVAAALPSVGRPVSVTASIFTSLPNGGSGGGGSGVQSAEKPKPAVKQLGTAVQPQQPSPALLQSVTAKLFVTLPASGGASGAGGCNGVSGGGSGAAGSKPQHATEKIFAPRTEDMNKGFLMFSEEEPGLTMLKDEPDDLTHLAPTAGDACIPLEESGTFFNDEMFGDFIIPDSYTLLQDELCSLDSQDTRLDGTSMVVQSTPSQNNQTSPGSLSSSASSCSSSSPVPSSPSRSLSSHPSSPSGTSGLGSSASSAVSVSLDHNSATGRSIGSQHNATSNDPFINYRDETSEVSPSPHLLSPGISKSPESSSLPSLCSPNGSLAEDDLAFMSLNMDEIDLTMRAPYISMSEVDDLPLLTSDDLLWGAPAATIDGSAHGGPFGLSGKFFIKDEFGALEQTRQQQQQQQHQHQMLIGKQSHSLITDITIGATDSSARTNEGNNDSKSTQQSPPQPPPSQPSIESSLAALLCGGNVISIQAQETQPNASGNNASNQILIAQQHHQQNEPETQCQQNGKRMKLLEESLLQHPMVVLPASLKLCDGWKFDDLLQLNGAATVKLGQQQAQQQTKKPNSPTNGTSHKRSLSGIDGVEPTETGLSCKRHKAAGSTSSSSSAPQLLQQLMAPSPVPQKLKGRGRSGQDGIGGRWPNGQLGGAGGMQQEQSGNSVLMNLLVSGCDDAIPLVPPETLIDDTGSNTEAKPPNDTTEDVLMNLGDEDDSDMLFSSANPLIGGQALLDESIARPLTIRTDHDVLPTTLSGASGRFLGSEKPSAFPGPSTQQDAEFSMTVSPSLLTPTDLEIWRAIQAGQLDPKKLTPIVGVSRSDRGLLDELDPVEVNLLAALADPGGLQLSDQQQQQHRDGAGLPYEGTFRTIAGPEEETLQRGLI
ncbi:AGAP002942-PA-like protein [Anopheles sinensis]|uniref:AGAP002942-PA-like protein n=1 Tax=Anopheles sinensis TaxID=74873 RepID=A0A084WR62_ANOSI|nr:AGAP002942-PA-like protein [Anopheles sinensis]